MKAANPNIDRWLEEAGLRSSEFRLLARIARRAGHNGVCCEAVPNMARGCGISQATAQRHLPSLIKAGFVEVSRADTSKSPKHYRLARRMHLDKDASVLLAIFVPAWLDDLGLSPGAFRLYYHYLHHAYEGEVQANRARAARMCFASAKSTAKVEKAEVELLERDLLERVGQRGKQTTYAVRNGQGSKHQAADTTFISPDFATPTEPVHLPILRPLSPNFATPYPPILRPKGLWKGLAEGSRNDGQVLLKKTSRFFFEELLGEDYAYFTKLVARRGEPRAVMNAWLAAWGTKRIREVWTYLQTNKTLWHDKHRERDARLYGLHDTMVGEFNRGHPFRLSNLHREVQEELAAQRQKHIPHFMEFDIVRVGQDPHEYTVQYSKGDKTYFDTDGMGCLPYAKSSDCTFVRHAPPPLPTEVYEPLRMKLKREALERRSERLAEVA